ncbi:MAG: hypothetical protein IKU34_03610 [Clostridia bacterium]|nr:hypothetical protein [Clostridia bacterium]
MIVQHRLIGNIPGRGHGDPLLSPAFPLDSALTTTTAYRAPDAGYIPAQAGRLSDDGKYHVHLTTFEIQSTHFGRPVLISANVFRPANTTVRPMIYMNTVAMTQENGAPISGLSPETLLSFDRFITPAHFAKLNAMSSSLSADTWIPVLPPMRKPFFAPHTAAHRALLGRYWAAASARLFGGNAQVFSICLGPQTTCEAIIENAKSLLLCDILPYLPAAVNGIASMSACVLESAVRTLFKDSALAVVFPTDAAEPLQPTFDLRRRDGFPTLSTLEDSFISAVLDGSCAFMNGVLARHTALPGCDDPANASFAADYDIALMLYQLERTLLHGEALIPEEKLITAWKMLNSLLINRHHLTDGQVNHLLADVEQTLFSKLNTMQTALSAIAQDDLPALWHKALSVNENLFPEIAGVIAASPTAPSFLKMLESAPDLDADRTNRVASMITRICETYYTRKSFGDEQIAQLTSDPMLAKLNAMPEIRAALSEGLRRSNGVFSDNLLQTLPLTCLLLDGKQALLDAVALLHARYLSALPSAQEIGNLASAYKHYADEQVAHAFCAYFCDCLPIQITHIQPLCAMISSILPETDGVIAQLLDSARNNGILLDAAQTCTLFMQLLPKCTAPKLLADVYAGYEQSMTAAAGESAADRLMRLSRCAAVLNNIAFDAAPAVADILVSSGADAMIFTKAQGEAFANDLWPICHARNLVFDAFRDYLSAITANDQSRYFTDVALLDGVPLFAEQIRESFTGIVYNILAEVTKTHLCAPVAQIDEFFGTLLPLCTERSAIQHQLIRYVDASAKSAEGNAVDLFPWLRNMYELAKMHGLLPRLSPHELALISVRYLCSRCGRHNRPLSENEFAWMTDFAAQEPAAFSEVSKDVLSLYDGLLAASAGGQTEAQAIRLLASSSSTASYPSLCELDKRMVCNVFVGALAESGYDAAFSAAARDMERCAMTEEELLARTQKEAREALNRQFAAFRKISDFEKALRSSTAPRDLLYNAVLKEHFVKLRDSHAGKHLSLEQMDRLNSVSNLFGIGTSDLPQTIRRISEIISQPVYDGSTFAQCMDILRKNQIDPPAISKELYSLLKDSLPYLSFPQNVHAAMLCCLSANAKNVKWKSVFAMLGMTVPEKMPKPFSAQGQSWLAFIHALMRALDLLEAYPGCSYGRQLIDYLCNAEFAEFTQSLVSSKPQRLAAVYPEYPGRSPLLGQWLSC